MLKIIEGNSLCQKQFCNIVLGEGAYFAFVSIIFAPDCLSVYKTNFGIILLNRLSYFGILPAILKLAHGREHHV